MTERPFSPAATAAGGAPAARLAAARLAAVRPVLAAVRPVLARFAPPARPGARARLIAGLGLSALVLAGCLRAPAPAPAPAESPAARAATAAFAEDFGPLPPMRRFGATVPLPVTRPNPEIARDILELTFQMESGRKLPILTRYDGPVYLRLAGAVPATAPEDLRKLVNRLRHEAGIDLRMQAPAVHGAPDLPTNLISIEFLPRAQMQALVPTAACFVVPRMNSWADYAADPRSPEADWATLQKRDRAVIFIPSDTAPQEVRDCLHEELAQALGPLNDLYRLPDSVYNDDNFHAILTGFDMLVLRVLYAPELQNGMGQAAVAQRLPALLERLNPRGGLARQSAPAVTTPRAWIDAVETALGPRSTQRARLAGARRALALAQSQDMQDGRLAFSWFILARIALNDDLETAFTGFLRAALLYRASPGMALQAAHIDMQLAAFALSAGQAEDVLTFTERSLPVVRQAENASLLATLLLLRAEAEHELGHIRAAHSLRQEAAGWARYGFGTDAEVYRRMADIAALAPPAPGADAPGPAGDGAANGQAVTRFHAATPGAALGVMRARAMALPLRPHSP